MGRRCIVLFGLAVFILLHNQTSLATDEAALFALKSHISSHPNNSLVRLESLAAPATIEKLQRLSLSFNEFTGTVPRELENLTALVTLFFGQQLLEGKIPVELGNLKKLQKLGLTENEFTGSVPASIFNISVVQATKGFNETNLLGNGSFSKVYKGILKYGTLFAAKRLDIVIDVASAMDYLNKGHSTAVVQGRLLFKQQQLQPLDILLQETFIIFFTIISEYGQNGIVSTSCDVYNFGILTMEMFTRTRPGDEIFIGDLTIQRWVSDSFPGEIRKVVDSNLVQPRDEKVDAKMQCLLSIMELALSCTFVTPDARISIENALSTLKKIRLRFVSSWHLVELDRLLLYAI
ncbi:hypothetical protein MTR67_038704 [Solanum verrucosum]|uniref:Protein kinase domain-containing protein n=1 Tax=Solanum verrucosum TaxID=315347 RepID=A0AAF0ZQH0_SOLVR|nr:hypothetical protein MTR67_038704 [Solanum verrucosum]